VEVLEFHLPHSADAPARARRLVEEQLTPLLPPPKQDDLLLLVSELVANAVRHSEPLPDGTIGLQIERSAEGIRVAVTDGGKHLIPDGLSFHTEENGHFGLYFVDRYADRWGFSLDGVKGVWFMMDLGDG
jgi:anti-sigma regulatory factor (Ser/Thr protein kinase)